MKIGNFGIGRAVNVCFSWLPHRLTFKGEPAIYHWLWWNFSWDPRVISQKELP